MGVTEVAYMNMMGNNFPRILCCLVCEHFVSDHEEGDMIKKMEDIDPCVL